MRWTILACLTLLASGAVPAQAQVERRGADTVPGELVVRFEPGVSGSARADARADAGVVAERALLAPGAQLVRARDGDEQAAAAALEADPRVRYAEPNRIRRRAAVTPPNTRWADLYGMRVINAPLAWDTTQGDPGVVVAVIDEGVAYDHPDLAPNMWANAAEAGGRAGVDDDANGYVDDARGWDFVTDDADPRDEGGHGTHVAGTIAAPMGAQHGIVGVAPKASMMALRVLGPNGGTDADIADAFLYARDNGATIVNGSFGGPGFSRVMSDAIAASPGVLFVVAAGNDGHDVDAQPLSSRDFPCAYTNANVVCVAATDAQDRLASFSNTGATSVDLAAPGVRILSAGLPAIAIDDFEGGDFASRWTTTSWGLLARDGGSAMADSPAGSYTAATTARVTTANGVSLAGQRNCMLAYDLRLDLEPSSSGKAGDWIDLYVRHDGAPWTWQDGYSGSTNGSYASMLSSLDADGATNVQLRFALSSDASIQRDGVAIDDLVVRCAGTSYDAHSYAELSGTSMATPHVAGAAALVWATRPGASVATVRAALLASGTPVSALAGRTVTGRRLDAAAAVAYGVPVVESVEVPSPGPTAATIGARIDARGQAATWTVSYGVGSDGERVLPALDAGSGTGTTLRTRTLEGLAPATTYRYRVTVSTAHGTSARTGTFTTAPAPATATGTGGSAGGTDAGSTTSPAAAPDTTRAISPGTSSATAGTPVLRCRATRSRRRLTCTVTPAPAGRAIVRVTRGGRTVARARVTRGRAVLKPRRGFKRGVHVLELSVPGDAKLRRRVRL